VVTFRIVTRLHGNVHQAIPSGAVGFTLQIAPMKHFAPLTAIECNVLLGSAGNHEANCHIKVNDPCRASGRSLGAAAKKQQVHHKIRQIRGNSAWLEAVIDLHRVFLRAILAAGNS
jgi:hypothetical protein